MMDLPELLILDVAHGNSAIVTDGLGTITIDCAPGSVLVDTLEALAIRELEAVIISHADQDHIGGLTTLLTSTSIRVRKVYLNADHLRNTDMWKSLRYALRDARRRGDTSVHVGITTALNDNFIIGNIQVEILSPSPEIAMSGVGGVDLNGRLLTKHSMCVAVGISYGPRRVALLLGDIDETGWQNLIEDNKDISAEILVFPHHGGLPGVNKVEKFAKDICTKTEPRLVIFSNGRGRFGNPRQAVVSGVRGASSDIHIMCTQLAESCAAVVPTVEPEHLISLPAQGRQSRSCCGGTIRIQITSENSNCNPAIDKHRKFVSDINVIPSALCRR